MWRHRCVSKNTGPLKLAMRCGGYINVLVATNNKSFSWDYDIAFPKVWGAAKKMLVVVRLRAPLHEHGPPFMNPGTLIRAVLVSLALL